ncbi:MAG TPA: D-sedoheptulose 7-phosphate isomerase [Candidatus Sulfotelmatobacter sp.]|nr:D-sedoheptulose 7-phosphate isomerase [Candidatus Sulfotelmatobacter sp.]
MKVATRVERLVAERIEESVAVHRALLASDTLLAQVAEVAAVMGETLRRNGTVFFFGNGGSAADAQHLAAELAGKYLLDRPGMAGVALTTNTSCLTAIGNDFGYDLVFARQLEALGSAGDVAIGISTSGNSANILRAFGTARTMRITTAGFTGATGGKMRPLADYCLCIPSEQTARIQEAHILLGHVLCEIVEDEMFGGRGAS